MQSHRLSPTILAEMDALRDREMDALRDRLRAGDPNAIDDTRARLSRQVTDGFANDVIRAALARHVAEKRP